MHGPKMLQDSDRSWRMASGPPHLSYSRKADLPKGKSVDDCRQEFLLPERPGRSKRHSIFSCKPSGAPGFSLRLRLE